MCIPLLHLLLIMQLFLIIDIIHCIFFFNDCITQWLEKDNRMSLGMLTIHMLEHHGGSHYILPSKKFWLYFMMCHMLKLQPMQGILNQHPLYPCWQRIACAKCMPQLQPFSMVHFMESFHQDLQGSKHDTLPPKSTKFL